MKGGGGCSPPSPPFPGKKAAVGFPWLLPFTSLFALLRRDGFPLLLLRGARVLGDAEGVPVLLDELGNLRLVSGRQSSSSSPTFICVLSVWWMVA